MRWLLRCWILACGGLLGPAASAQVVEQWYDEARTRLRERFHVAPDNPAQPEGAYEAFYESGQPKTSGQYAQGEPAGAWTYFYESGRPRVRGTYVSGQPRGHWQYFYESGQPSREGTLIGDRQSGLWRFYHEGGGLQSEGHYRNGAREGEWRYYHPDGSLKGKALYVQDRGDYEEYHPNGQVKMRGTVEGDQSTGFWQYFHENGQLSAEGVEEAGQRHGIWRRYYPDGKLQEEGSYHYGAAEGYWRHYHPNGQLSREGRQRQGQPEGEWKSYYASGRFRAESNFRAGEGPHREYHENGQLRAMGTLRQGQPEGQWLYYDEAGRREGRATYVAGAGEYEAYYPDGTLRMRGQMADGKRVGLWEMYQPDGTLAGYYQAHYDQQMPGPTITPQTDTTAAPPAEARARTRTPVRPSRPRLRYFQKREGEWRTVILGFNPLAVAFNQLPFSAEYYLEKRLGYELRLTTLRTPFFASFRARPAGQLFSGGFAFDLRQKFYHDHRGPGLWYLAHELRYVQLEHGVYALDPAHPLEQRFSLGENRYEYSWLVGLRLFDEISARHNLTLDLFGGLGIGYRTTATPSGEALPPALALNSRAQAPRWFFPVRAGITLGYHFGR